MSKDPRAAAAIAIGRVLAGQSLNQVLPRSKHRESVHLYNNRQKIRQACGQGINPAPVTSRRRQLLANRSHKKYLSTTFSVEPTIDGVLRFREI